MLPPVPSEEVSAWKQELKTTHPTAERGAWLHLWLGEWELAQNEQPAHAAWHFRQAQHLTNPHHRCFGLAAYDQALALFYEGAYGEATDAFAGLLQPKKGFPGYDRRNCALWLRHAQACANYHAEHAKLSIPEPARLDPFCGAASLAACLRSLSLAYDRQTVLKACVVTGEGSSLQDVLNAGRKLGLNARSITADDAGLKALPKPLMAYVEQDHFVALVRADSAGVSYLCSDCGPWPGGRVDLTWAQWHALNPGVYAVVTKPGSRTDALLQEALAAPKRLHSVRSATQVSYAGSLSSLRLKTHLSSFAPLSALRGHVNDYIPPKAVTCGSKPEALHCPSHVHCPMASPTPVSCHAPTAHDPVNLATGEEEYTPEPDLTVYNPIGPSVSWSRIYNSLRAPLTYPNQNLVDYGVGWSYSYNLHTYAPNGFNPSSLTPQLVYLIFPNGSSVGLNLRASNSGAYSAGTASGVPFAAEYSRGAVVLTMRDGSRWTVALNGYLVGIMDRNRHSIYFNYAGGGPISITDDNNKVLLTINGNQSVSDCYGRTVWYQTQYYNTQNVPSSYPQSYLELTNVSQVLPTTATPPSPLPSRYAYDYANVYNGDPGTGAGEFVAFLHKITVPSPTGSGTSTATLWYLNQPNDGANTNPNYSTAANSGPFVSAIVDSNGNTTTMTPINSQNQSQVQVTDSSGKVLRTSLYGFDSQMQLTSLTDYNRKTTQTRIYNDPYDGFEPSSITDGNNYTWSFSWDRYGHLTSETPPSSNAIRTPLATTYTYDSGFFPLGELTVIQTGYKKTTITYNYTGGYAMTAAGPYYYGGGVGSITSPKPGQTSTSPSSYVVSNFVFDTWGNLQSMNTPGNNATYTTPGDSSTDHGITTRFNYTSDGTYSQPEAIGQPLTVTDNLGHVTHFRYDALGRSLSVTDALGYSTSQGYNLADQPLQVTRPATGQTGSGQSYTAYSYQYVGGPLAGMTAYDESGNAVRQVNYQYGSEGETLGVGGSTEPAQYAYDGLYRLAALADGNGHATHYYFNPNGYLDSVTYPGYTGPAYPNVGGPDSVHYPQYDGDGNPLRRIDGNGETDYTYNDPESLLTTIHYPGGQLADVTNAYDNYSRVSSVTDGTGRVAYSYDDLDNPLTVLTTYTGLPTQTVSYAYFNDGSRSQMGVPYRGYFYSYDAAGRLTGLSNNVGESAAWAYQNNDWPLRQTDSNGLKASPAYNALGQLTDLQNSVNGSLISEFGQGSGIRHDGAGNVTSVAAGVPNTPFSGVTNYAYDSRDQLTQENSTRSGGYTIASAYDLAGNPTALRGVPGLYNADNQDTLPAANNPAFLSDGNGNPGAARGRALTFDPENRLAAAAGQAGAVPTAIAVGPDNLLRLLADNNDGSSTLVNVRLYDGSIVQPVHPPYGPFPNWTAVTTAVGPNNVPHFLWNRIDGAISVWTVDAAGNYSASPQYGPFPGWTAVGMAAGPDNAVYVLWNHAPDNSLVYYRIDPTGSYTQFPTPTTAWSLPAGWSATGITVDTTDHVHLLLSNVNGQFAHWTDTAPYGPPGYLLYTPPAGFLAKGIAAGVTSSDGRIRILLARGDGAAQTWVITSDTNIGVSPVFGPYAGYTPVNLVMDWYNVGRLLFGDSQGDNFILNILPDNASTSILTSMTASHAAGTGEANAYRGDGLRAWKQNDTGARTYYLYDGSVPVCELDGSANVVAQTMFGAQGLVSRNTQTNGLSPAGTAWYAFDERGNVSARTGSNGAVVSTDLSDGFGNVTRTGGPDVFGFGGQAGYYTDTETGLILCTNRHYDPQSGRFLTRDPIGYDGGVNLYGYAGNNPANWSDPDGTQAVIPAPVFYAGAGLLIWWYLTHTGYQPGPISWPWPHPTTVFPGQLPYPTSPLHSSGPPDTWPKTQDKIPGGPWVWHPNPTNSRGGVYRGPVAKGPSGPAARPELSYGKNPHGPGEYWKCKRPGQKTQDKYDPEGNPLPEGDQGHPTR